VSDVYFVINPDIGIIAAIFNRDRAEQLAHHYDAVVATAPIIADKRVLRERRQIVDLEAIKARAQAATEGPWDWGPLDSTLSGRLALRAPGMRPVVRAAAADVWPSAADAVFIAAARSDIPALVTEVERLQNEIKALRNDEDYDPAPIVTEYDRVVEQVEHLTQQNARLRAELHDLGLTLDAADELNAAERDVIEKAKAWAVAWRTDANLAGAMVGELLIAVDALTRPEATEHGS
jgi:hypothetical protein